VLQKNAAVCFFKAGLVLVLH